MDQDDFDNFEFIDYTTSGPWERFIVQIEDCLKQWGLIHNSYGVFNPTLMPTTPTNDVLNLNKELALAIDGDQKDILQHNPNLNTTTTPLTATILNPDISSNNGSSGTSGNSVYQHNAIVTLDRDSYVLSYSYHPAKARMAVGVEQIDLDFLPTKLEGHEHHILHRWTALTHILILAPAPTDTADGDSSSSVIVDLGSAKLLLSSFAIAFQNTGCNIPVFVPTGHPKNKTYTGLSIQPLQLSTQQQHTFGNAIELGLEDTPEDQAIEVRFNTVVVSYPPAQYTNLSGILDLFIERMGIEDEYASHDSFNAGRDGTNDDSNNGYSREVKEQIYVSGLFSYQLENWYDDDWRQWTDASIKNDEDSDNASGDGDGDDDDGDGDGDDDDDNENDELKQLSKDMKRSPLSTVAVSPISKVPVLPLGPIHDPLKTFHLVARFASAPSTVYLDSKNFTDMEASQANIWTLRVQLKREDYGLLSGVLEEAISSWQRDVSNSGTGSSERKEQESEKERHSYTSLLRKGAQFIQGNIAMVDVTDVETIVQTLCSKTSASSSMVNRPSIKNPKHQRRKYRDVIEGQTVRMVSAAELGLHFRHATTVPFGSLLWKMLLYLLDVISPNSEITYPTSFMGFLKAVWTELLVEFTNHWEAREMIPLVQVYGENTYTSSRSDYKPNNEGETAIDDKPLEYNGDNDDNAANNRTPTIDLRFNLIHQKLSMINCCIARENAERQQESTTEIDTNILVDDMSSLFSKASSTPVSAKSTPDPVVFELLDTTNEASPEDQESRTNVEEIKDNDQSVLDRQTSPEEDNDTSDISKAEDPLIEGPDALTSEPTRSTVDVPAAIAPTGSLTASQLYENEVKREGVMSAFNDLTLLETGAQLFVPKLQEPGYMTEDMIKQQEDIFEGLGSSSDAAKIRAQMQSAQLISDMSAFKAANPGCVLGDFIRWHSPKDWNEGKRQMSARMADSDNIWQEFWKKSEPIPASKQKPLFDHRQEAENALSYLSSLSGTEIFSQLLPTIFLIAYDTLVSHPASSVSPKVANVIQELAQELTDLDWCSLKSSDKDLDLKPILAKFKEVELVIGQYLAMVRKFPRQHSLVERLLEGNETVVEDGSERDCVFKAFRFKGNNSPGPFPDPLCREFVIETFDPTSFHIASTSMEYVTGEEQQEQQSGASSVGPISGGDLPGWHARPLQRRMYACFKNLKVRIVEAIAKDGMFM